MRLIARRTLREFVEKRAGHKDQSALKAALDAWFDEVHKAHWASADDVKSLYRTARIITAERVVFNIKGDDYRLVAANDYEKSIVWIKWLGTHADYDRIDVKEVEHDSRG
jgi:mRNA interferase HigB